MPDRRSVAGALVIAGMLCAARPASAQVQLQGLGGRTDAAEHAPFFAGVLGIKITFVEIDLEGGRLQNVLPSSILDQIHRLEQEHGLPLQAIVRVPATYGAGSVRLIFFHWQDQLPIEIPEVRDAVNAGLQSNADRRERK